MPEKRKVGRPKKGKPTWKPAAMLDVPEKVPGFRLRWCDKDALNLQRKKAEGWIMANEINGIHAEHDHPEKTGDGHSMTSVTEYRDLVLMALPEDLGKARDKYFNEKTEQQTRGLKRDLEEEMSGGSAEVHGKIVIE